jgi:site-specific recombinase xerD
MRNTFKVLFYIKKNAPLRNGNTPIMGRITINGQRTQLSTQLSVNPNLWDVSMGRAAGRSAVASHVNEQLSQIRFRIERCYNTLFYEHALVTPKMVKEMYFGNDQRNETLLAFFRHHNEEFSRMVASAAAKRPTINIGVFTSISKTTSTTNSTARICCSKNSTKSS